jgi:hypothetical protein
MADTARLSRLTNASHHQAARSLAIYEKNVAAALVYRMVGLFIKKNLIHFWERRVAPKNPMLS